MTRMPRVALEPVADDAGLERLAATIGGDALGMAEFGGFYGFAVPRLGPLLGPERRAWIVVADGGDAGFLDADLQDGEVGLAWFVRESRRRRGVARAAVGRLMGLAPWPDAAAYVAVMGAENAASRALAQATGFALDGIGADGEERWRRPLPLPRADADDPRRFLDRGGRLTMWPARPGDRERLLTWLAGEVLPDRDEVVDERELGIRLGRTVDDAALARRLLVDHGMLERTRSGSAYRRAAEG